MSIIVTAFAETALFVLLYYSLTKKTRELQTVPRVILVAYLLVVLAITLGLRSYDTEVEVNLELFSTYKMMFERTVANIRIGNYGKAWQEFLWIGYVSWSCVILNVLLFVPLGYVLPLAIRRVDKCSILLIISILLSAMIEITQLLTHRGWFDIDDIFHNGLGAFIGWLCYKRWLSGARSANDF